MKQLPNASSSHTPRPSVNVRFVHFTKVLVVLCFLNYFCKFVLDPTARLQKESALLKVGYMIVFILQSGNVAVSQADELARLFVVLHDSMYDSYGISVCKIKSHLMHHLPTCLKKFQLNLNTFNNERRNRLLSMVARHYVGAGQRESNMKSLHVRMFLHIEHILKHHDHREICLVGKGYSANNLLDFFPAEIRPYSCRVGKALFYRGYSIRKSDLLLLSHPDEQIFALVECVVEAVTVDSFSHVYYVLARALEKDPSNTDLYTQTEYVDFVELDQVKNIYFKRVVGACIRPLDPAYFRC
jgi:hypothetical protein